MNTEGHRDLSAVERDSSPQPTLEELLPERKLVVAIGINAYQHWPRLDRAVSDALGVRNLLAEKFGFESPIEPLLDGAATKPAIEALLEDQLRDTVQDDDALVVFFAGHGHTRTDRIGDTTVEEGYLAPVEARHGQHFGDLLNIDDLLRTVGRLRARHILVVLDACNSGMALGSSVAKHRSPTSFVQDLALKRSRRVITSARASQPALDTGPIADHSLFTGTLVDGLTWGKADTDGNGIITSSELGLYLQQQVGQASESRQTPDFGAFELDDRGELLIALGEDDFTNVKARAYSALQSGERGRFTALVDRARQLRPDSPETAYLEYRQALASGQLIQAADRVTRLEAMHPREGVLPLSYSDISALSIITPWWQSVFSIQPSGVPVQLRVLTGSSEEHVRETAIEALGDLEGYSVQEGKTLVIEVTNSTQTHQHVYLVLVGPTGKVNFMRLWRDIHLEYDGLPPGTVERSLPFKVGGVLGLEELWIFVSERRVDDLVHPPSVRSRALLPPLGPEEAARISLKKLYVLTRARLRKEVPPATPEG